jgi:hypothetical protein
MPTDFDTLMSGLMEKPQEVLVVSEDEFQTLKTAMLNLAITTAKLKASTERLKAYLDGNEKS